MNVFNINRVNSGFPLSYFLQLDDRICKKESQRGKAGEKHFTRLFGKMGLHFFLKRGN